MMLRTMSRRNLFATAISGAVTWLGGYMSFLASHANCAYSIVGYSQLIVLCSNLRCPRTIGQACLVALPAAEGKPLFLARTILSDVMPVGGKHQSPDMFSLALKDRSRADFREGRVVTVDGWILSLTETRVYALIALLHASGSHVG